MHDAIKIASLEHFAQLAGVAYIANDNAETCARPVLCNVCPFDLGRIEVVEIVNDRNVPTAFRDQFINEMRTDKAGAAGH
jgi:hypothetical protein